jgi:phosphatidylserine/phosphatidylglycerophosphate/cardiolipin synthase-like enzyme
MKIPKNLRIQAKFLLLLVFLTSLLSSCTNEYFVYHQKQESFSQNQKEQKENVANWSPESVEKTEISVFTSPEQSSLDRVIRRITEAKKRVDIEVYMLSEKRIIDALKEAKMRGVIIRVILEPNPYGNPYINKKTFATLEKAGIPVVLADDKRYVFTHAKFMLVDDVYVVMTANMTHSAFVTNREFFCE